MKDQWQVTGQKSKRTAEAVRFAFISLERAMRFELTTLTLAR